MISLLKDNLSQLNLIFQSHKVEKAYVFGSAVSGRFSKDSDIDFLITFQNEIEPLEKGELWWSLYDTLRALFKKEIDIMTESSLKNPYFIQEIDRTKELIYG